MKLNIFALYVALFTTSFLWAADPEATSKLTHESEAGVILTAGNSDTQTYSVKQVTGYSWDGNATKLTGSYLLGKTAGVETAKKWDLGLRYERTLFEKFAAFAGYQIDTAPFAGTYLRHTVDLGGKYGFIAKETSVLFTEVGYRMTAEEFTTNNGATKSGNLTSHMSRIYIEQKESWTETLSTKLFVEYLQSFTNTKDYRINFEPSASVLLNKVFSVKIAYLLAFRNVPAVVGKKQTDSTFTTSLVAKF